MTDFADEHDCWTCAYFFKIGKSRECQAEVKGGTMYTGWKPPCENWKEKKEENKGKNK